MQPSLRPASRTPNPTTAAITITTRPEQPFGAIALTAAAALALVAASVLQSPIAAACAVIALAATWRWGSAVGALLALLLATPIVVWAPLLQRPLHMLDAGALGALLVGSVLVGALLRSRWLGAVDRAARPAPAPRPRESRPMPERNTPARGVRAAGADAPESEVTIEQEMVQRLLRDIREHLRADDVILWQLSPDGDEVRPFLSATRASGIVPPPTDPTADSLVHWAVHQGLPASNYDTDRPLFLTAPVGREGRFQGAVSVYAVDRQAVVRDRAKSLLGRYAARMGMLMDLLQDGRETRRYRGKAETLAKAAERLQRSQDMAGLGQAICETAIEVSGGTRAAFVRWHEEAESGTLVSVSAGHPVEQGFAIAPDSLVGTACRERQRFAIREAYRMSDFPLFGPREPPRRVNSVAVVPLYREQGVLGAMLVEGDEEAQLTSVEGSLLYLLSQVAAIALANVEQLEMVTESAFKDKLTGLPNRRAFDERIRQHLGESDRFGQSISLILVDLDRFKSINDTHGHDAGDAVLAAVARAMAATVRNIDLCARYGGEELAILLPQTHLQAACDVAERLRRTIESLRIDIGTMELRVTASLGVASYPESVRTQDQLFSAADKALYAAKDGGRNCFRIAVQRHGRQIT